MISAPLWLDMTIIFPIVASHSINIGKRPLKNFVQGDTTAGEFNCDKPLASVIKRKSKIFNQTGRINPQKMAVKDTISVFWDEIFSLTTGRVRQVHTQ